MKAMIADLHTISQYDKKKKAPGDHEADGHGCAGAGSRAPAGPPHPETGRKALYISYEGITRRIAGMTEAESRPILSYLLDHATRPEFTCRFRWQVNSLALWDNRRALHFPINDYNGHRRVMHRITVEGERTL